jgi:acyl carrier protein
MTPTQKILKEALLGSGWMHPEVAPEDSLLDLGFDSLALALWVSEVERTCSVKIPFIHLTIDNFETIEKASLILEPILRGAGK